MIETQYPVRSMGATAFAVGGGVAAGGVAPAPRACAPTRAADATSRATAMTIGNTRRLMARSSYGFRAKVLYTASTNMSVVHGPESAPNRPRHPAAGLAAFTCATVIPRFFMSWM